MFLPSLDDLMTLQFYIFTTVYNNLYGLVAVCQPFVKLMID